MSKKKLTPQQERDVKDKADAFDRTLGSNRPTGCHPQDCCGDPSAHKEK